MSEYWKSTVSHANLFQALCLTLLWPKYWCKHCKTFVRDTKLERTNHEATPKHQGNIKRFIRDLHRGHEKDEREKQRAKNEVERLNGVVSGDPSSSSASAEAPWKRKSAIQPPTSGSRQATPAERKAQLAQLAAMGVAVPEDYRREMAMAGDWQTLSETPVYEDIVKKEEDTKDVKPSVASSDPSRINIGVRKRKFEGQEEEEEAGERVVRKGRGSTTKSYPGAGGDLDLDALLNNTKPSAPADVNLGSGTDVASEPLTGMRPSITHGSSEAEKVTAPGAPPIKKEDSMSQDAPLSFSPSADGREAVVKDEQDAAASGIVFKKRKAKPIRGK